jgi:hypothetical protein
MSEKKRKIISAPVVLGISGHIGSGKSSLAAALTTSLSAKGWTVYERNFADKLKELVAFHFGIEIERCYTQQGKNTLLDVKPFAANVDAVLAFHFGSDVVERAQLPKRYGALSFALAKQLFHTHLAAVDNDIIAPVTVGRVLQLLGTHMRQIDDAIWVNAVADFVDERADANQKVIVIVPDCRFPNEANWVKQEMGGLVVRLNGDPGQVAKNSTRDLKHISETALDDYDGFDLVLDTDCTCVEECAARVLALLKK